MRAVGDLEPGGPAVGAQHDLQRHDAIEDGDALMGGVVHLVLGGGHLVAA